MKVVIGVVGGALVGLLAAIVLDILATGVTMRADGTPVAWAGMVHAGLRFGLPTLGAILGGYRSWKQ